MGWDINGWIEVVDWDASFAADDVQWKAVALISPLVKGRDYDAFGCLFGVRNYARFRPIAPERGLPDDVSSRAREDYERLTGPYMRGFPSWVTWADLAAIDWEEPAGGCDERIHEYKRRSDGSLRYVGKSAGDATFGAFWREWRASGVECPWREGATWRDPSTWPEGTMWTVGTSVYRVERLRRSDVYAYWADLLAAMRELAQTHGPDGVRLVVWFVF